MAILGFCRIDRHSVASIVPWCVTSALHALNFKLKDLLNICSSQPGPRRWLPQISTAHRTTKGKSTAKLQTMQDCCNAAPPPPPQKGISCATDPLLACQAADKPSHATRLVKRERDRDFTPAQPHRAGAGAARTSPGRSQYRVFTHCVEQRNRDKDRHHV